MSQFGKASSKRGKPTYAYAIIGVALVLFLFGIVGWFFLNLRKTGDFVKEKIQVHAWLSPDATKKRIDSLKNYIAALPYARDVDYITREKRPASGTRITIPAGKNSWIITPSPKASIFISRPSMCRKTV